MYLKILLYTCLLVNLTACGQTKTDSTETEKNASNKFPKPHGSVNDFGNTLSESEEQYLTSLIDSFQAATTNQIGIVTVDSIKPYDNISEYSKDLFNEWGLGMKDKNNGLLIVFCRPCREVRISTGYGTIKILSDSVCKRVIDEIMIPNFKEGKYFEGIKQGSIKLINLWSR